MLLALGFLSQLAFAQYDTLWTSQGFEKNQQYPGYIVDLDGDTTHGYIQFADRVTMQDQVHFFLEKSNKKTDSLYFPADLTWHHFLDKTYQCINYSGGVSTRFIKGVLMVDRGCISKFLWYSQVEKFGEKRRQANESFSHFMNRIYPFNEVYYHNEQRKAITLDYFQLSFEKRMTGFVKENPELVEEMKEGDYGTEYEDILDIFQVYNTNCK